jgi:hypothetical protein
MGLWPHPRRGKNASVQQPLFMQPWPFPLSSRAKPRDLEFRDLSWKHGVSSRHKFVISPAPVCRGSGVERSAVMFYPRLPWLNNPIPLTNSNNLIRLDLTKLLNLLRSRPLHLDQIHRLTFS